MRRYFEMNEAADAGTLPCSISALLILRLFQDKYLSVQVSQALAQFSLSLVWSRLWLR